MRAAVPTEIQINERDIYGDGWECRSTYETLVTDPLKLIAFLNAKHNLTVPLFTTKN